MKKKIGLLPELNLILLFYTIIIAVFSIFRLFFFIMNFSEFSTMPKAIVLNSFFIGFRFDTVIACYILIVPTLLILATMYIKRKYSFISNFIFWYVLILLGISMFIEAADLPYFLHFKNRITISALMWSDTPDFMVKMVFQDLSNYKYFVLYFLLLAVSCYCLSKVKKSKYWNYSVNTRIATKVIISILVVLIMFVGIRGRLAEKSPIRWGTACFSNYIYANQMALNPVYTFLISYLEEKDPDYAKIKFIEDKQAIANVKKYFNIIDNKFDSPIARLQPSAIGKKNYNVVLVIMESMALWKTGLDNGENLTNNLDNLAMNGVYFSNFYSAGIHTRNGIYSSLMGLPSISTTNPMKQTKSMQSFSGIANTLKSNGYSTIYMCTHDDQFDNMAGFLSNNGFERIISQSNYPKELVMSTLGVPDSYMFDNSLKYLDELASKNKPFFAAMLTASDHKPYVIPQNVGFKAKTKEMRTQVIEYADWSIGRFIENCKKKSWFNNTIFVFVADHGASRENIVYDMPLEFHHIPLIMYAPNILKQTKIEKLGQQIDIFPTMMDLLGIQFVNNTFGYDLFTDNRPYVYMFNNENFGILSNEYYLVLRKNGVNSLYKYKSGDIHNYISENKKEAENLKIYGSSMVQTAQWMIENRKVKQIK